jgi:phosphoribosyl-ATP pyrophosphohydrolase
MTRQIEELYEAIICKRGEDPDSGRTARLFASGRKKIGKKLGEEAFEVMVELMKHHPASVIRESADLLYHLAVVWAAAGVTPAQVWDEMDRRTAMLGLAEKLPKGESVRPIPNARVSSEFNSRRAS